MPEPAASLMRRVNARDVKGLGRRLLPALEKITYPDALSADHSAPPRAPVFLLHGADDTVIPSVESLLLARHLAGVTHVRTLLSGLITHAEVDRAAAAGEVIKLVGFWARSSMSRRAVRRTADGARRTQARTHRTVPDRIIRGRPSAGPRPPPASVARLRPGRCP